MNDNYIQIMEVNANGCLLHSFKKPELISFYVFTYAQLSEKPFLSPS